MYQHRRPSSSGVNDSAVYTHLKATNHTFEDKDVNVLDKEHMWFERRVKEAIYVRREEPSLNRGGGLHHNLPRTYDSAIKKIPRSLSRDNSTPSRVTRYSSHQNNKCKSGCDLYHFITKKKKKSHRLKINEYSPKIWYKVIWYDKNRITFVKNVFTVERINKKKMSLLSNIETRSRPTMKCRRKYPKTTVTHVYFFFHFHVWWN